MVDKPYFMINKEWYYFDVSKMRYVLTDKAPQKAKESYEKFYKNIYGGFYKK